MRSGRRNYYHIPLTLLSACGADEASTDTAEIDADPLAHEIAASEGFQLRTTIRDVLPGDDVEWCEVVEVPGAAGEVIWVDRVEVALADRSHHANVLGLIPGSNAAANAKPGDIVDCVENGQTPFGTGLFNLGGGAGALTENTFPDGVGLRLEGGQRVVLNVHYVNTGDTTVPGQMLATFYTTEARADLQEMRRFGMYNEALVIPPHSEASYTMACTMRQDVYIHELSRHTHRWGTNFNVWFEGGDRDGEHVFESLYWDTNLNYVLPEPVLLRAGDGFRFTCDFANTEDHELRWGDTGSEEMCILYGRYFTADPGAAPDPQGCWAMPGQAPGGDGVYRGLPCPTCP